MEDPPGMYPTPFSHHVARAICCRTDQHAIFALTALAFLIAIPQPAASEEIQGPESAEEADTCKPTRRDALGPNYNPNAPIRSKVGEGYVLRGTVRSSPDCVPISGARIEFWLVGPNRSYSDDYRATIISDENGKYVFECEKPKSYGFRPAHIHIRVSAEGRQSLVTQHYPRKDVSKAKLDLVLSPSSWDS